MRVLQIGDMAGVAYKMTQALSADGVDARLLVCEREKRFVIDEIEAFVERLPYNNRWSNVNVFCKLLSNYTDFDIYHGHSLMNIILHGVGLPYVAHFHGSDVKEVAVSNTYEGALLRMAMRKAEHVLYCTHDLEDGLEFAGVEQDRRSWLPNPIDLASFKKAHTSTKLMEGFEKTIFHPQRIHPNRHNELFFKAFVRIAGAYPEVGVCWVHHDRSGELHEAIETLIRKHRMEARFRVIPRIEWKRMVEYLNAADIVVDFFNSSAKAVSQTTLEAMSCEKPTIAAVNSEEDYYLRSSPILPGGSVDEIESSLRMLLDHPDRWGCIGREGRDWVAANHGVDMVKKRIMGVYSQVIDRRMCST